jgi:F420-0:gamma-glutamyl ligase
MTKANVPDALAAAAVLLMGEANEQTPLAIISDIPFVRFQQREPSDNELAALFIETEDDLYAPLLQAVPWQRGGETTRSGQQVTEGGLVTTANVSPPSR